MRECIKSLGLWRPLENPKLSQPGVRFPNAQSGLEAVAASSPQRPEAGAPLDHTPCCLFSRLHYLAPVGSRACLFTLNHSINTNLRVFIWLGSAEVGQRYKHGTKLLELKRLGLECGKHFRIKGIREFFSTLYRSTVEMPPPNLRSGIWGPATGAPPWQGSFRLI